jgi:quercetin dioxygenase-like cupin family protein
MSSAASATASVVTPSRALPALAADKVALRYIRGASVNRVTQALGTSELVVNVVFFEAGGRVRPHSHSYDQLLVYTEGTGVVHVAGDEERQVDVGDCVLLPAGVAHMHGAATDGPAVHLSIMAKVDMDFDCPIPEDWVRWRDADDPVAG